VYLDLLYGSGLRAGFANEEHTGFYNPVNVGIEHTFNAPRFGEFKIRFDIVNIFDESYELRNGTGIGVFAPQYGPRRGFYGGLSKKF
jgi:outer membrane receptor protein involved in Fe transport